MDYAEKIQHGSSFGYGFVFSVLRVVPNGWGMPTQEGRGSVRPVVHGYSPLQVTSMAVVWVRTNCRLRRNPATVWSAWAPVTTATTGVTREAAPQQRTLTYRPVRACFGIYSDISEANPIRALRFWSIVHFPIQFTSET